MDWIVGLLLLVVGAVIGFFVAKFISKENHSEQSTQSKEETVKQIMAQQAATHLTQSRLVVNTLQAECDKLREQMDAYESLLTTETQQEGNESLSYFGEHATVYLRNQQAKQKRERSQAEFQPKDFSSGSSGLFDDSKNQQVVDK